MKTLAKIMNTNEKGNVLMHFYGHNAKLWTKKMLDSDEHPIDFVLKNDFNPLENWGQVFMLEQEIIED